jgi:hypothetical protein
MPVHAATPPDPRVLDQTDGSTAKGISSLLIVHSLRCPDLTAMPDVGRAVLVERPQRIIGTAQPLWFNPAVCFRDAGLTVAPFSTSPIRFHGRAYLPYVPNTLHIATINPFSTIAEVAYERGSLRGRTIFGAALHVSDEADFGDWYQITGYYEPQGPFQVRTEVRALQPVEADEQPRVHWSAAPDFGA